MVFSSVEFLFLFLPIVLLIYYILNKKLRNIFLLLASLFFYAWGEGIYIIIMLVSTTANHFFGKWIDTLKEKHSEKKIIIIAVLFNIGLLGFFKYANFFMDNVNNLLLLFNISPIIYEKIHLPIGVSFFTFHCLSYVIDVYRGQVPSQKKLINTALYIALFPQLIAGPIIRYYNVAYQLIERVVTREKFALGIKRFIIGLGKKVLIANTVALAADKIFAIPADQLTLQLAWIGVICFWLQIYFDFSGYSDMAIGLAHMFGFTFLENFNYPYISLSVREYWVRWHISLTSWLRDYLYFPLGGNRISTARTYFNLVTIFFVAGLWHGASWTFVIWGLYNGIFMALERDIIKVEKLRFTILKWFYTFMVLIPGYAMFRADTVSYAFSYISAMYGGATGTGTGYHIFFYIQTDTILAIIAGLIGSAPICPYINNKITAALEKYNNTFTLIFKPIYPFLRLILLFFILFLSVLKLSAGTYNPFIYFRF